MGRVIVVTGASDRFASLAAREPAANDDSRTGRGALDLVRGGAHGRLEHTHPFTPPQYAELFAKGAVMSIFPSKPTSSQPGAASRLSPFHSGGDDLFEPRPHSAIAILMEHRGREASAPRQASVTLDNMSYATELHEALSDRQSWAARAASQVKRFWAFLRREREIARAVAELHKMTDRDLYDIGVERGRIVHTVRHGRDFD